MSIHVKDSVSLALRLAQLSDAELDAEIGALSDREALEAMFDWRGVFARDNQQLPETDPRNPWFTFLILSGRGFGKTRVINETGKTWIDEHMEASKDIFRLAMIAETAADARDVLVEGESGMLTISPPWFMPDYEPSKRRLTWRRKTGKEGRGRVVAQATLFAGNEPDQLRGPQHHKALMDELAKYVYPQETWDNMEFGLRLGEIPQVAVATTPRPIEIIIDLVKDPDTVTVTGSSYENIHNLAPAYVKRVIKKYEGTRLGDQEIHARILTDMPGALIPQSIIDRNRVSVRPKLQIIYVAIDPSVTSGEDADEVGIMVGGRGYDDHAYLFHDASGHFSPEQWASMGVVQYVNHGAAGIVAERNNGGELVRIVMQKADPLVHPIVELVWAADGKDARAEEPGLLYEQGLVHHVGHFGALESELTTFVRPGSMPSKRKKLKSPNRADAALWLIWKLMIEGNASTDSKDYHTYKR